MQNLRLFNYYNCFSNSYLTKSSYVNTALNFRIKLLQNNPCDSREIICRRLTYAGDIKQMFARRDKL